MKLKDVITLFDYLTPVSIFFDNDGEDAEPYFKGFLMDIPWHLLKNDLAVNESQDYSALDVRENRLIIVLKEE